MIKHSIGKKETTLLTKNKNKSLLNHLVDDILEVDLAGGGENPEGKHGVLAQAGPRDHVQLLALYLVEGLPGIYATFLTAESNGTQKYISTSTIT